MVGFSVRFEPVGKRGICPEEESLLQCARRIGIQLESVCGGMGLCGSCRVRLIGGRASEPTQSEKRHFSSSEIESGWRLACQVRPLGPVKVFVPLESMSHSSRLQIDGREAVVSIDPRVQMRELVLSTPTLSNSKADADRLSLGLKEIGIVCNRFDINVLKDLSSKLRQWSWMVKAAVRDNELIGIIPKDIPGLGLAVDLGTTKIALYLVDLETGKTLAATGVSNPQIVYGEDIITRIHRAVRASEDAGDLQRLVVQAINNQVEKLCNKVGVGKDAIFDIVLVGNTAMHHLLLGLPLEQLAVSPFVPVICEPLDVKARDLGLEFSKGAYVHLLPNIAGFVGADHVAVLLATGAWKETGPVLVLDIGTNTEISLVKEGQIFTVSTPSGPAFEGGHIKHGMRAVSGAIEKVKVTQEGVWYKTIDDTPPLGICGSGIIDTIAELFRLGVLDERGRLQDGHHRVRNHGETKEFVLVTEEEREGHSAITITQNDVRELQLAKASIRAGIQGLLEEAEVRDQELEKVFVAGAFGSYIDIVSAVTIGMLVPLPLDRFVQVGNAAGIGAKLVLLSRQKQKEAEFIAKTAKYIELANSRKFQQFLVEGSFLGKYIITPEGRRRYVDGDKAQ